LISKLRPASVLQMTAHAKEKIVTMRETSAPIRISIFDRSIACACRPGEQRGLMVLKGVLHGIRKEYGDRIEIAYHAYDQRPEVFQTYGSILELMRSEGLAVLPVTLVNGAIKKSRALPTLQELREYISTASE
jgi:hypothetical protein